MTTTKLDTKNIRIGDAKCNVCGSYRIRLRKNYSHGDLSKPKYTPYCSRCKSTDIFFKKSYKRMREAKHIKSKKRYLRDKEKRPKRKK